MISQPRSYDDLEDNFWELDPDIDKWDAYSVVPYEEITSIPGYAGMGNYSYAVRLSHGGQDMVIRYGFGNDTRSRIQHTESYTGPLLKGVGIPYTEQVVAAHRLYGFVLSGFIEGEDSRKLSPPEMETLPDSTVETLAGTLLQMYSAGVYPDCVGCKNILYNQDERAFSFIDYIDKAVMGPQPSLRKIVYMASLTIGSAWEFDNRQDPEITQARRAAQSQLQKRITAYMA